MMPSFVEQGVKSPDDDPAVFDSLVPHRRRTRILCTLGPSTADEESLRQLILNGADALRFNYSHGTHEDHARRHALVRKLESELDRQVAILADLQGPKIRIGDIAGGRIPITSGQRFVFHRSYGVGDATNALLDHPAVFDAASPGRTLLIDDGKMRFGIDRVSRDKIHCTAMNDGVLMSRKGVSLPDVVLSVEVVTEKDRADLKHALSLGVEWVALSFVQSAQDIRAARAIIPSQVGIIAKIERPAAITNIEDIVQAADAVMVARGDLGVETGMSRVPVMQKQIVRLCRMSGRPVIVATQMLESMIASPIPTRAEVSDIATAVYDGADVVMLSAETASGDYPVEAVRTMHEVITETERHPFYYRSLSVDLAEQQDHDDADAIARAAVNLAEHRGCSGIICFTESGSTARRVSRFRPMLRLLAVTRHLFTARKMLLVWGVETVLFDNRSLIEAICAGDDPAAHSIGWDFVKGDRLVFTAGTPIGRVGSTNMLRVKQL